MNNHPLPTEFAELEGHVSFVKRVGNGHYRSSCPECKDAGHNPRNGSPDRFQMWITSRTTGGPFGWCNRCGYKWWPGRIGGQAVDPETIRRLQEQARINEAELQERRREKLAEFSTQEIWLEYCERMQESHQQWWLDQGVPLDAQGYLSLGFKPEKIYMAEGHKHKSPAYTIPWFGSNFDFITMQYRLTNPVNPADKYRFEYGLDGGRTIFFRSDPGQEIGDKVIVCEGAKKAIVTRYQLLPVDTDFVVLAAASKNTLAPVLEAVKDCGLVYVIMDPDGLDKAKQAVEQLGKNGHVVHFPYKVDDGFLRYGLNRAQFGNILDTVL